MDETRCGVSIPLFPALSWRAEYSLWQAVYEIQVAEATDRRRHAAASGDKWSFLIFAVLEDGPKRFNEIRRLIGDISQRILTRKLRELERDGYVSRTVHSVSPPKVVYELTKLGRSVLEPISEFMAWTLKAYPEIQRARAAFDRSDSKR